MRAARIVAQVLLRGSARACSVARTLQSLHQAAEGFTRHDPARALFQVGSEPTCSGSVRTKLVELEPSERERGERGVGTTRETPAQAEQGLLGLPRGARVTRDVSEEQQRLGCTARALGVEPVALDDSVSVPVFAGA